MGREPIEPRDVSPFLKMIRNFLLGRKHKTPLRNQEEVSARTQPPPDIPFGPCHKLSANRYYSRDGRRDVKPPIIIAPQAKTAIEPKKASKNEAVKVEEKTVKNKKLSTPGRPYNWD